jgi:uncharacterized membrane protein
MELIFPAHIGHDMSEHESHRGSDDIPEDFDHESCPVMASDSGYIQTIDNKKLLEITTKHDIIVQIHLRPGDYAIQGNELVGAQRRRLHGTPTTGHPCRASQPRRDI